MKWNLMTVGNPNSGKTSLFNALTGANQQVGNWSGVTVDKKSGYFAAGDDEYLLMDLPGIYALESRDSSIDEQIAFRYAMTHKPDLVINVIDATALERSLLLTLQLRELGLPVLVVLNKYDVMRKRRQSIDVPALSHALGCPVVALSPYNRKEITALKEQLPQLISQTAVPPLVLDYGETIESAVIELLPQIHHGHLAPRGCALRLLEGDPVLDESLQLAGQPAIAALIQRTQQQVDMDLSLADVRYGFIHEQARPCVVQHGKLGVKGSERLDALVLNRWLGIPIFLAAMYLMFLFAINFGSAFIDFFDILAGALFVDGPRHW